MYGLCYLKLRSLWADFLSSKSDKDKIMRLNKLLPHFLALYESRQIDVRNMIDVFGNNAKAFAFGVSRRLVKDLQELARSLTTQPRDAHAREIYRYFSTCGGALCGFELLYTVEALADATLSCEAMSEAGVPSALVRALQLLFLVPATTLEQSQGIIEDKIIKTLCNLSRQKNAIEELQKSDTLSIIFSLMSAECSIPHRPLRSKIVSFGLELNDLYPPTITYINSKKIISHLIKDLNNYNAYTIETYVSICQMIIKLLGESAKKSAILLEDFQKIEGYQFIGTSLFRIESHGKEKAHLMDTLLESLCSLVYVGYGHITIPQTSPVPYQTSIAHLIKDISTQSNIAKNESAFLVLERYFLRSKVEENRLKILDRILSIYSSNPVNFLLLQHLNTLPNFIVEYDKEPPLSDTLKYHVMKIVCFVVTVLNVVPFKELSAFSILVNENPTTTFSLEMVYQLITTLVNFEFRYKHIFREAGLLDILIKVIDAMAIQINAPAAKQLDDKERKKREDSYTILLDSIYLLIAEHPDNIGLIRKYGFFDTLLTLVPHTLVRGKALRILQQLIKYDPDTSQREFDGLVKMLTTTIRGGYQMKTDIFNSIRKLFNISKHSRDSFREHGGFVSIVSVLIGMESSYVVVIPPTDPPADADEKIALLEALCRTTTSALCGNQQNRASFEQQIGYQTFASGLAMTGVLASSHAPLVVDFIFDMVTENLSASDELTNRMVINNVDAFHVVLEIIGHIPHAPYVYAIISRLNDMADFGRANQEALSRLSIPDWILTRFPAALSNIADPLQPLLLRLIQSVGANCLSGSELRRFVRLLQPEQAPEVLLKILSHMAHSPSTPPYFEFNLSKVPYGYVHVPLAHERTWPPTNGYTILFWLYIERSGPITTPLELLHVGSDDRRSSVSLAIKAGVLTVTIVNNSKYVLELPNVKFDEGRWYHIGIVHARRLLSGTDFKLFVDGFLRQTASRAQYPAPAPANSLICDIGATATRFPADQIWRVGPFYLMEEALSSKHINTIYFLGPNYSANFRGRFSPYQTYEIINHANLTAIRELDYGDQLGPLNLAKVAMHIDEARILVGLCASNKRVVRTPAGLKPVAGAASPPTLPPHMEHMLASTNHETTTESRIEVINQAELSGKIRAQLLGSVEAFRRNNVADGIRKIGGMPIALLLLEKAADFDSLYDALALLVGLLQGHATNTHEMSLINGYELAAWVLRSKSALFDTSIVDLVFTLVGLTGARIASRTEGTVANWNACKHILMSASLWRPTPVSLQRYVLQGFNDLIVGNEQSAFNAESLRKVHAVQELLDMLVDDALDEAIVPNIIAVLYNLLNERLTEDDIRLISAYLISGLHTRRSPKSARRVYRTVDRVLQMFLQVVATAKDTSVIFRRVSAFWCFFFINSTLPPLSVSISLKIVCAFFIIKHDYCHSFIKKSGFKMLEAIIAPLAGHHEIYISLFHLLLGSSPIALLDPVSPDAATLELPNIYKSVERNLYCIEAAHLILALVKRSYEANYHLITTPEESTSPLPIDPFLPQATTTDSEISPAAPSPAPLPTSSPASSSGASPLSSSQTIGPSTAKSNDAVSTSGSHALFTRVGHIFSRVEERTMELVGAFEEVSDGSTMKKKRSSISSSPAQLSAQYRAANLSQTNLHDTFSSVTPLSTAETATGLQHTVLTYFMYLFHENASIQPEFFTPTTIEALAAILFVNGRFRAPPPDAPTAHDRVLSLVLRFLCQIVLVALHKATRAISVAETVIDAAPLDVSDDEYMAFHTRILADVLTTVETNVTKKDFYESSAGPAGINTTLVRLSAMLVDRVHADLSRGGVIARRVLMFLVRVLEKLEADGTGVQKAVLPLYRCLNRVVLFMLARPHTDPDVTFTLNYLLNHQRIYFSDNNSDTDFICALSYPLFKLLQAVDAPEAVEAATKIWRLIISLKSSPYADSFAAVLTFKPAPKAEMIDLRAGFELLNRKDHDPRDFRSWLAENMPTATTVFEETAKRAHTAAQQSRDRSASETLAAIKQRRKERIAKRDKQERKISTHEEERHSAMHKKTGYFVRAESERRRRAKAHDADKQKFLVKQFESMRDQITRERAVWGPPSPSPLDKWKLDSTEGPFRMRKKTEKNYDFYKNYPYVPAAFDESSGNMVPLPCSQDSQLFLDCADKLEPAYCKFTAPDGTIVGSGVRTPPISNNGSNTTQQPSSSSLNSSTRSSKNIPNSSEPSSPLCRSSSTDVTPPGSPINSSSEDAVLDVSTPPTPTTPYGGGLNDSTTTNSEMDDIVFQSKLFTLSDAEKQELLELEQTEDAEDQSNQQTSQQTNQTTDVDEEAGATNDDENQAYTRLLDPYDQSFLREEMRRNAKLTQIMYNCGSVDGMDKVEGILLFCPVNMYIFDGYVKDEATGDVTEVEERINTDWLTEGAALPVRKVISHNCRRWGYEDVREVLRRRYLLRPVALEIFSTDGRNSLIVLKDETTRDDVYHRIVTNVSNSSIGDVSGISGSQTSDEHSQAGADLGVKEKLSSIFRRTPLTQKWQSGQISNFQYLMHLNTLAGRSYNDLTQYPVFPWVLTDYESEELDIDDPRIYRDLSKPMGALNETRAAKFRERFESWDPDEENEHGHKVPPFHYGTHYSSAAIVLYYLIRLEPFTQHFLKLQGGRWDQADRLFSSVGEAWQSSCSGSTGSIMELIPEFYYLPDFLSNDNHFNFGFKQGGDPINDVVLPPWAKGSAAEFVRLHRRALESEYVSEHLHEWIDLIFGYKQQGKPAEDALNVFYYLTYEGAVNIDAITDVVEKAATIAQINNFGQTPKQLFDKPHPRRVPTLNTFPFYAKSLVGNFIKDIGEPVGQIRLINERATCVGLYKHLLAPAFTRYVLWGLPDGSIRYHTSDKVKALEDHHDGPLTCLTATDDGYICVSGGSDSLICVYNLKRFSLSKRLCGHTGAITALAASRPFSVIISGSEDQTCIIWDLNRLSYVRTLTGHDGPISCIGVHDTTGDIVTCSGSTINIYTINGDPLLSFRTSQIMYDQITSCLWSKGQEWLGENVLVTGHRDGKIKVWGLESRLLPSLDNDPMSKLVYKNVLILRSTFHNPASHTNAITALFLTM
eukprot:gene15508-18419_t